MTIRNLMACVTWPTLIPCDISKIYVRFILNKLSLPIRTLEKDFFGILRIPYTFVNKLVFLLIIMQCAFNAELLFDQAKSLQFWRWSLFTHVSRENSRQTLTALQTKYFCFKYIYFMCNCRFFIDIMVCVYSL